MSFDQSVAAVREAIIKLMGRKTFLRSTKLVESLVEVTGESAITVRQALARLAREKWVDGIASHGDPVRNVKIIGEVPRPPPNPALDAWQAVLDGAGLGEGDKAALIPLHKPLACFGREMLSEILCGLLRLRENLSKEEGRHRFIVSARYLIGSSKLLDTLPAAALKAFGIPMDRFPSHPLYVVAAGSEKPEAVVLVENPAAFELAVSTRAIERVAFIATFGFGLSKSEENYGNQLADMVESDRFASAITLTREGSSCPPARELLKHPNITFWGDLDVAGIHIYLRMQKAVPGLRLSALYVPMIDTMDVPSGHHPYEPAVGKGGQGKMPAPAFYADAAADYLLFRCKGRGVDQETVSVEQVVRLAGSVLTLDE